MKVCLFGFLKSSKKKWLPTKLFSKAGEMTKKLVFEILQKMACIYLLAFLLTSLGESLWDDLDRELSLWDLSERSDRSDFGDGDFTRLPLLLRDGLGDVLCRLFLWNKAPKTFHKWIKDPSTKLAIISPTSLNVFSQILLILFSNNIQSSLYQEQLSLKHKLIKTKTEFN